MHQLALLFAIALPAQAEDVWPPATRINEAAALQLTPAGLDAVGDLAGALIPGEIPVEDQGSGTLNGSCWTNAGYALTNLWVGIESRDIRIVPKPSPAPGTGLLVLDAELDVWMNLPSDKFNVSFAAPLCISDSCDGYVNRFPVAVSAPITLAIDSTGPDPVVDAIVGEIAYEFELDGAIVMEGGCLGGVNDFLRDYLGFDLYDFLIDLVVPLLDPFVQDFASEIETQLEDALRAANFRDTIDVNGVMLNVHLFPSAVNTSDAGLEVVMAGQMDAPPSACVEDYGILGSKRTATGIPPLASLPPGTQAMMQLSDDIANQAAFAAWYGGLLCFTLPDAEGSIELPIPLNTSLLGILAGDAFDEIFPETKPMVIKTAPRTPPVVDYDAGHDIVAKAHDLDLNFFAEFDHRMGRALGVTINADVPIDLRFNGATGELAVDVELEGAIAIDPSNNELRPDRNAEIAAGMRDLINTLIDSFAGDALSGLAFGLPSANGFGLTDLSVDPQGTERDWLGAEATLGPVTYGASGEGCGGGCGDSGTGGCSATGSAPWALALLILPALRRRRR